MSLPREMLRISRGEDRAGALRARALWRLPAERGELIGGDLLVAGCCREYQLAGVPFAKFAGNRRAIELSYGDLGRRGASRKRYESQETRDGEEEIQSGRGRSADHG